MVHRVAAASTLPGWEQSEGNHVGVLRAQIRSSKMRQDNCVSSALRAAGILFPKHITPRDAGSGSQAVSSCGAAGTGSCSCHQTLTGAQGLTLLPLLPPSFSEARPALAQARLCSKRSDKGDELLFYSGKNPFFLVLGGKWNKASGAKQILHPSQAGSELDKLSFNGPGERSLKPEAVAALSL